MLTLGEGKGVKSKYRLSEFWSLGAVAYRAVTGRDPFRGEDLSAPASFFLNLLRRPPIRSGMGERVDTEEELLPGASVGDYFVQGVLGTGGCAVVYLAEHRFERARVALKVMLRAFAASPRMIERFEREVEAMKRVRHPGIVEIHGHGRLADGRPYYVMELLEGTSLDAHLKDRGRLSPAEAMEIMEQVGAALNAVHEAGIVHRDIKAANIFLVCAGEQRSVKILDFGIAKLLRDEQGPGRVTTQGHQLGTPSAMAPEQILGHPVDPRTDVYALGILAFRLLTGRLPFQGKDLPEIERWHLEARPPRPSDLAPVDRAVDAVVLRCLEKRAADRYPGVRPLLDDLRRAVAGTSTRGLSTPTEAEEPARRAVAIHVEARVPLAADEEPDDALFDEMGALLEDAERALRSAGFDLPVQTAASVLAVRLLPATPAEEPGERRRAVEVARALHGSLLDRRDAGSRVEILICVHEDVAAVEPGPNGARVAGGPILRLGGWLPTEGTGVFATRELADRLAGGASTGCSGRYRPLPR